MSAPEGASVNDSVNESVCSLSYVNVDDAADGIRHLGTGTLLAKIDIKSAYRNVPIHPDDRWLMGMYWDGALYIDTALPFGLRSAPKIFTAIADAAEWIVRQAGVNFIMHYLDDFLVLGAPASRECSVALGHVINTFGRLGLPLAVEKLEGPSTRLEFLGFELDSREMVIRLPPRKLRELQALIRSWVGRTSCLRKDLESIVGKLAHAARVVKPGKTFMRRMFETLAGARQAHHHIRINSSLRSDIIWWNTFISAWNGISMIPIGVENRQAIHIWTDASGNFGCGALDPIGGRWLQLKWPEDRMLGAVALSEESITLKELIPIILACAVWGNDLAAQRT